MFDPEKLYTVKYDTKPHSKAIKKSKDTINILIF